MTRTYLKPRFVQLQFSRTIRLFYLNWILLLIIIILLWCQNIFSYMEMIISFFFFLNLYFLIYTANFMLSFRYGNRREKSDWLLQTTRLLHSRRWCFGNPWICLFLSFFFLLAVLYIFLSPFIFLSLSFLLFLWALLKRTKAPHPL